MKTEDLVRILAADARQTHPSFTRMGGLGLAGAAAITAILFMLFLGARPDLAAAASSPRFALKLVVVILLGVSAWGLLLRAGRPGVQFWQWLLPAALALALLTMGVAAEFFVLPPGDWLMNLRGKNWLFCLTAIPALSLIPLAAALATLRYGAPTRPAFAGAIAGFAAAGIGATFYALNCDNDSPLFVATWYTLAIGAVACVGAVAGSKLLRW